MKGPTQPNKISSHQITRHKWKRANYRIEFHLKFMKNSHLFLFKIPTLRWSFKVMVWKLLHLLRCSNTTPMTNFSKPIEIFARIKWHRWCLNKQTYDFIHMQVCPKFLVKVINADWSNLICNLEISNKSCKENHLLFQRELDVFGLWRKVIH